VGQRSTDGKLISGAPYCKVLRSLCFSKIKDMIDVACDMVGMIGIGRRAGALFIMFDVGSCFIIDSVLFARFRNIYNSSASFAPYAFDTSYFSLHESVLIFIRR